MSLYFQFYNLIKSFSIIANGPSAYCAVCTHYRVWCASQYAHVFYGMTRNDQSDYNTKPFNLKIWTILRQEKDCLADVAFEPSTPGIQYQMCEAVSSTLDIALNVDNCCISRYRHLKIWNDQIDDCLLWPWFSTKCVCAVTPKEIHQTALDFDPTKIQCKISLI